jgi:hypothetical protein
VTPEETRDLLVRMANSLELMETDCLVYRAVLQSAQPRPGEPPLQTQVDELRAGAARGIIHERYEQLRAEIRRAADDRRMVEIALRLPPVERPN